MSTHTIDPEDHSGLAELSAWLDGEGEFPDRLLLDARGEFVGRSACGVVESWQAVQAVVSAPMTSATPQAVKGVARRSHAVYWLSLRAELARQAPNNAPVLVESGEVLASVGRGANKPTANDERFRWAWGLVAGVAAIGLVGLWTKPWLGLGGANRDVQIVALDAGGRVRLPGAAQSQQVQGVDPTVLMAHHRPMAGSPFQATAGFVRSVTYEP